MSFHEVSLPARLAFGSTGGVERRTEVVTLASGHERRSTPWASGRRRYLIGSGLRSLDDMAALTAFFEARQGRLYGFRFRDFADFKSCAPGAEPGPGDQSIGIGDGVTTQFPLVKAYGGTTRRIAKPVEGTVRVAVDGVEVLEGWSLAVTTGEVTFETAPGEGVEITAGFRFDTPVRFDADRIRTSVASFQAGEVPDVPVVEVRV